jgi:hypothetical protein
MARSLESLPLGYVARPAAHRAHASRGPTELDKQLRVYAALGAGLFVVFALDTQGGGGAAIFASTLVTLLLTGVAFGLSRWASLLERTLSPMPALLLAGVVPALLGRAFVHTFDAAPKLFRAQNVAGLWAAAFAVALVVG